MKFAAWTAFAVVGLVILSAWVTGEGVMTLVFGWIRFLGRVLPKVRVNRESAAVGGIALALFSVGVHWLGRGAYRAANVEAALPRTWRIRWTAAIVALVIVAFVAGTSMIGAVHQVSWLAKSEQPLLGEAVETYAQDARQSLKMITLGTLNAESARQRLPSAAEVNDQGQQTHGWEIQILPFMGASAGLVDRTKPWNDPQNQKYFRSIIPFFINPDFRTPPLVDEEGYGLNHYSANSRVLTTGEGMALSEIEDGVASTILLGEVSDGFSPWGQPGNVRDPAKSVTRRVNDFGGPRSRGGTAFGMVDGSVRMIADDVDPEVLRALATPDGSD